jgi:hypothetical protein
MSIADTCEESAFEHGRSVAIEGFTTKELVDELSKRKEVKLMRMGQDWVVIHIEYEQRSVEILQRVHSRPLSEALKAERNKLVVEMLSAIPNEGMAVWEERGYLKFINSFRC